MIYISSTLFKIATPKGLPTSGSLFVAEPLLEDKNFNHAVISLLDYDPNEGATGAVMNKPTGYMLNDLLEDIVTGRDIPVYCGGPLGQDRLFYLHTLGDSIIPGARRYAPGLYVGGDFGAVIDYVNSGYPIDGNIRFFIGYSSWVEGQLEKEIDEDTWAQVTSAIAPQILLTLTGDAYWHHVVRALGSDYRSWNLFPYRPSLN